MEWLREERIERAWQSAKEWFEPGSRDPDAQFHTRYPGVDIERVQACFQSIERRAVTSYTSSVWKGPEVFDPEACGVERSVEAFREGKLFVVSIHYELLLGKLKGCLLLTVLRSDAGAIEGHGVARQGFVTGPGSARDRFGALVAHAIEVESLLGASGISVGPGPWPNRSRAGGKGEAVWVGV